MFWKGFFLIICATYDHQEFFYKHDLKLELVWNVLKYFGIIKIDPWVNIRDATIVADLEGTFPTSMQAILSQNHKATSGIK